MVLVTANFTWLGLVGLVPRKSAHWYNITTEEKKHPAWFREDLSQLLAMLQEKSLAPWSRSSCRYAARAAWESSAQTFINSAFISNP